jgi:hypothetical protein
MSEAFAIVWDWPALATFYQLPLHTATIVDRAVLRFAERGEGHLEWVPPYHRLRAGLYDLALSIDTERFTITVIRIYRRR